jgi:hypothetical protein
MKEKRLILLHALTPLHVGTGQAVANVDLPIAREKATGFPIVPASALKGVLRDNFSNQQGVGDPSVWRRRPCRRMGVYRPAHPVPARAQLLWCVRLHNLPADSGATTQACAEAFGITGFENLSVAVKGTEIAFTRDSALHKDGKVYLEDLDLAVKTGQQVDAVAQAIADKLQLGGGERATSRRASRWFPTMCSPS